MKPGFSKIKGSETYSDHFVIGAGFLGKISSPLSKSTKDAITSKSVSKCRTLAIL
jgi:hypothetical protein